MPGIAGLRRRTVSLLGGDLRALIAVAALFLVTFAYLSAQALRVKSYVWMVDELLYTKSAQAFASDPLHASMFGQPYPVPNALYSRILAVPYGLISNLHAFSAGHVINALLFASASIPVYLLARRLGTTHVYALVAGALAVWVPWAVAVLVLMSESAAYPAFAWALLIVIVAIVDPRPRNDALLIVASLGLVYTRTQFLIVLPAFGIGLIVHELAWPALERDELTRRLRAHWLLGLCLVLAFLFWLVVRPGFLGNYARTTNIPRFPTGLLESMADHLTHVLLGVGVIPALLWFVAVVRGASAPLRREQHAFAYVSGLAALVLTYQAGFFSRQIAGGHLQERYLFYVVMLFALGTAVTLSGWSGRAPIGSLLAAAAVLVPIAGVAAFPPDVRGVLTLESAQSGFNKDMIDLHGSLVGSWSVSGMVAALIAVIALVVAAALYGQRWRRYSVPALAVVSVLFCVVETHLLFGRVVPQVNAAVPTSLGNPPKAWVDGLLYNGNDKAGAIEGPLGGDAPSLWLWTEFWNSRVQRVYVPPGGTPVSGMPGTTMTVDPKSGRINAAPEMPVLVVSAGDPALKVRGQTVRTIITGQRLLRPVRPYRADFVYGSGTTTAVTPKPTELSVYPPRPGVRTARVTIGLTGSDAAWLVSSMAVRLRGRVGKGQTAQVAVTVKVPAGAARAKVRLTAPRLGKRGQLALSSVNVNWSS